MDLSEREREYSPSSVIDSIDRELAAYAAGSAFARSNHPPIVLSYGDHPTESIDLYVPPASVVGLTSSPVLVFIHGGYWQELSKYESAFMVPGLLAEGVAVAVVDYQLAPTATLEHIVEQSIQAVQCVADIADEHQLDRNAIVVAGSSAGAHLAASCAGHVDIAGLVLMSGIFDLRPLLGTYINDALELDAGRAERLSPQLHTWTSRVPAVVVVGEIETAEFHRQSREFAAHLDNSGIFVRELTVLSRNHFDLPFDLCRPSQIATLTLSLLRTGLPVD